MTIKFFSEASERRLEDLVACLAEAATAWANPRRPGAGIQINTLSGKEADLLGDSTRLAGKLKLKLRCCWLGQSEAPLIVVIASRSWWCSCSMARHGCGHLARVDKCARSRAPTGWAGHLAYRLETSWPHRLARYLDDARSCPS